MRYVSYVVAIATLAVAGCADPYYPGYGNSQSYYSPSGYSYPAGVRSGDHFFRFIGAKATVFEGYDKQGKAVIEVHTTQGVTYHEDIPHSLRMQGIMREALAAIQAERSFAPSIADALRILEIQDAVYAHARANPLTNGPHSMGLPAPRP